MGRYIIRRLIYMVPLLLGITLLTYAIVSLVPGSPLSQLEFDPQVSPADLERIQENLGLNEPWYTRYFVWLGNLLQGDLGVSYLSGRSVMGSILEALPNTLLLTGTALVFALVLAVPFGVLTAVRRNSWFDNTVYTIATAATAIPTFWLGLMAIILLAVNFGNWGLPSLPVAGTHDVRTGGGFWDRVEHLILPAVTLGAVETAGWLLYIRSSMLEVIRQDFVRTAEAKGLANRAVIFGHAFRNAVLSLVTLIGLTLPNLFGGAFIVEQIFAWPGIGRLTVTAAQNSDYTIIMGGVLVLGGLTLIANLATDVTYGIIDPRIRYD